jgi:hypothetical protein
MTNYLSKSTEYLIPVNGWQGEHAKALHIPRGAEIPFVSLLNGWLEYADSHSRRFETGIGEDYVLGPQWAAIGSALLSLLNGELGRLDGGSLDSLIRDTLAAEGFDADKL